MNGRIHTLEARRQALLQRCEQQRIEVAYRLAQVKPAAQLTAWGKRSASGKARHPFMWVGAVAGILMLLRRRRLVSSVGWATGLAALATRATTILRLIAQLRAICLSLMAARRSRHSE